jgi:hypothetical protein
MTSQSPRIYIYKITFDEVPYYYYGVHKEKYFNGEYWGSPYTNKWCWELYTPKKQILQFFEFSDEGWLEAQEIEKRLIKPFYNTDKWCLNESCGGIISLEVSRKVGLQHKENKTGIFTLTPEQRSENGKIYGKISGKLAHEMGVGVHNLTSEQRTANGKKGGAISGTNHKINGTGFFKLTKEEKTKRSRKAGNKTKSLNRGIFGLTREQRSETSKKNANRMVELGIGIHGFSKEKRQEVSKKSGKIAYEMKVGVHSLTTEQRSETGKKVASQKWECLETGFITNAGNLTKYQRKRGIDTSKRVRVS